MKKDSLLINGGCYGHIIIPVPSDWDKRSENSKTEYLNTAKKMRKKVCLVLDQKLQMQGNIIVKQTTF